MEVLIVAMYGLFFFVAGILLFIYREFLAKKIYEVSVKRSFSGRVTSVKWKKGILTLQAIIYTIIGLIVTILSVMTVLV